MPPQKRVGLFDTTSRPLGGKKLIAPPMSSAPTRPASSGTKQIKVDGVVYTVPADATADELAEAIAPASSAPAAPASDRPWSEGPGILPGIASQSVVPMWDMIAHPIDTATGIVKNLPGAMTRAFATSGGDPARMVQNFASAPQMEDVDRRLAAGDTSGAIASGLTSVANAWLPLGKGVGAVGRKVSDVGKGMNARVLNAPRQLADPVLEGGYMRRGPAAGLREAEGHALDAASAAQASAPTGASVVSGKGAAQSAGQVLSRAEARRLQSLGEVKMGADPGIERVTKPGSRGQYWRDQVRQVLPAEGQAAVDRISTLDPITKTLARAPRRSVTSTLLPAGGAGYFLGPGVGAAIGGIGAARGLAAPAAHYLNRAGRGLSSGLTTEAITAMQRAAILARLAGQDDDDQ